MHFDTHFLSTFVERRLQRWIGGATKDFILDPQSLELMREHARPIRCRFYAISFTIALIVALATTLLLIAARRKSQIAPVNPVLDDRAGFSTFGLFVSVCILVLCLLSITEYFMLPRILRWTGSQYERYQASTSGWRPRRQMLIFVIPMLVVTPFLFAFSWNEGECIDEQGMAIHLRVFMRDVVPYSEVASVTTFDAVHAPIGTVNRRGVVVEFQAGEHWEYSPEGTGKPPAFTVAQYISERSRVPISHNAFRP